MCSLVRPLRVLSELWFLDSYQRQGISSSQQKRSHLVLTDFNFVRSLCERAGLTFSEGSSPLKVHLPYKMHCPHLMPMNQNLYSLNSLMLTMCSWIIYFSELPKESLFHCVFMGKNHRLLPGYTLMKVDNWHHFPLRLTNKWKFNCVFEFIIILITIIDRGLFHYTFAVLIILWTFCWLII